MTETPTTYRVDDAVRNAPSPCQHRNCCPTGILRLTASEHMGRSIERLVRLHQTIHSAGEIDHFHREVIEMLEVVAAEHRDGGELILIRLRALMSRWSGPATARARACVS